MHEVKKISIQAKLDEKFLVESQIRDHRMYIDQTRDSGGEDRGPTPVEYMFLALAACLGSVARVIAHQKKIVLRAANFTLEGDLDIRGFLGKDGGHRVGVTGIKVLVDLDADLSVEEKKQFLRELDKRCPVSDNLESPTPITVELNE